MITYKLQRTHSICICLEIMKKRLLDSLHPIFVLCGNEGFPDGNESLLRFQVTWGRVEQRYKRRIGRGSSRRIMRST